MNKRRWIEIVVGVLAIFVVGIFLNFKTKADDKDNDYERIKIIFWHEMTGAGAIQLKQDAEKFNQSQTKYEVVPEFEGDYNTVIQKVLQTSGTSASPALFQSMDVSTAQISNANITTPVQKFIDNDHYDMSDINAAARAFYSKDNTQLSMPFNTSQPTLFYNKKVFKKYGVKDLPVDPTYSQVALAAKQITQKSNGSVKGFSLESKSDAYGWFFEEFMSNANQQLANYNDGRNGYATQVNFTNSSSQDAMKWLQNMIKDGSAVNFGSGSNSNANQIASFLSDKLGMTLQSSASMGQLEAASKPGELGVTYYPKKDGQKENGVAIGGASLWISNDKDSDTQNGAWQFIKYLMKPAVQANWQKATGYISLNKKSQSEDTLKQLYEKRPETQVPSKQLSRTTPDNTNSGIFMEGLVQMRSMTENAIQQIELGHNVNKTLSDTQKQFDKYLIQHNEANGYVNK